MDGDALRPAEGPQLDHSRERRARPVAEVRQQILDAAYLLFRERSYEGVTLTEIGARVGLTRGAVLYHFHFKADVLSALLAPYVSAVSRLLDEFESGQPPPPCELVVSLFDVMLSNRPGVELLTRDLSSRHAAFLQDWSDSMGERLLALLVPDPEDDPTAVVRGLAAVGALTRPLAVLPDPAPPELREAIIESACAALLSSERSRRYAAPADA